MSKVFLCFATLLLSVSWVVAQQDTTSPSASGSQSSSSAGQSSSSASANETTIQGCLTGSAGNFTLTDNAGTTYQLTGDTSELSKHVNEEVSIRGTQSASSGAGASSNPSTSSNPSGGTPAAASQSFSVTHVKKMADTCTSKK